jgi:hypothetical protein
MSKYQPDTRDLLQATQSSEFLSGEERSCMFRAMKFVLGDYVCDHGIQERKVYRSHTYKGLRGIYKRAYDVLSEELLEKMFANMDAIGYWTQRDVQKKLEELIKPIEEGRNRGIDCKFVDIHFALEGEKA